jgi:uncharacterized protein
MMVENPVQKEGRASNSLEEKLGALKDILSDLYSVLVAYSGGTDSTLLLKVAHDTLGDRAVAATAVSASMPQEEAEEAIRLAREIGAQHLILESEELDDPDFRANTPDRCYHCKYLRFQSLLELARERGLQYVADGCNLGDLGDHRPGMRASRELGVRSPLMEAGLNKAEIRELSRHLGLPTWDKPAEACLASRIPYGTPITRNGLQKIEDAERFLHSLGLSQVRVRVHGDVARIEVDPQSLPSLLERRSAIASELHKLGFSYVTADLEGYRTGSMNEVLGPDSHG